MVVIAKFTGKDSINTSESKNKRERNYEEHREKKMCQVVVKTV